MILVAPAVLSPAELSGLRLSLKDARFGDGRSSAGEQAREQKHVLQLDRAADAQRELGEVVARALLRHPLVQSAVLPKSLRHPTINRYEPGMYYGPHLDAPLMRGSLPMRADVSVSVFLSEPTEYEGGELVILAEGERRAVKGAAGDAVLYASGSVHEVTPVTSGARLVAVTWLQSMVRSAERRRLLHDLAVGISTVEAQGVRSDALLGLRATYDNLLRLWLEP